MAAKIANMPEAPTAANIDVVSLQISLPQMLDLALGAPEVGAVNFNILHNFLHILLHQINLQSTKVEYRGENADRIKVRKIMRRVKLKKNRKAIILSLIWHSCESYYRECTDAAGEVSQRIRRDDGADADVLTEDESLQVTNDTRQQIGLEKVPEAQMVVSAVNGTVPAAMTFKELEKSVKQLQQQYQALEDLSTSPEVVERLKDRITDPAADVWQFININKRLDTNEQVIKLLLQLTTIIQDVVKGDTGIIDTSLINARLDELEDKVSKMEQWLINLQTVTDILTEDIIRMVTMETNVGYLFEKVDDMQATEKTSDVNINKLVAKVQGIETDMEKIGQAMNRLLDDREKQETDISTLLEQIEFLKTVKANKEDLEDALADKADTHIVNRKVSHDKFDAACDDLARGLEEAIDKLSKQESIWQQALDEVQNEIAAKMDKDEMMPLKDFVNSKLKSLQEKLKIMIEARREIEAAGTKKLLRDVQCISCDKDVVMRTEEIGRFYPEPLPCTTSVKPYLTYELDKVRKQQRKLPYSRNMIQFEAAMQEQAKKMKVKEEMLARTPRDHLCNRYCGGSHTITTPQQRVMRTGHFLTQWGPEAIQLTDGLMRGKDGQMYRSRPMPGKDVCEPHCWESQISEETAPSVNIKMI
ncbi:PREDICTED: uncharacterized protein LOC105562312 [Vollenhovia emeryi]|uniref:uncharacterized protein LOC105562312 n=1 Tax=Vollenhovia emeryi TaxID=411798 RepID=UPI0005F4BA01|nr:PREDICTED: uncharacterized protein LOC105562312 [Vollenhovia emeryi]